MSFSSAVATQNCKDWEFDCYGDGQTCISDVHVCDKTSDCPNGQDESKDLCPDTGHSKYCIEYIILL